MELLSSTNDIDFILFLCVVIVIWQIVAECSIFEKFFAHYEFATNCPEACSKAEAYIANQAYQSCCK